MLIGISSGAIKPQITEKPLNGSSKTLSFKALSIGPGPAEAVDYGDH